jgi:hypothetical protein
MEEGKRKRRNEEGGRRKEEGGGSTHRREHSRGSLKNRASTPRGSLVCKKFVMSIDDVPVSVDLEC